MRNLVVFWLMAMIGSVAAIAQHWDAYNDWAASGAQPENGWQFLEYDSEGCGVYTPLTWAIDEWGTYHWHGTATWTRLYHWWQASDTQDAVWAWTAPESGQVHITSNGNVRKGGDPENNGGDGMMVRIKRDRFMIFERFLAYDDFVGFPLDVDVRVNAGDTLYFHLNSYLSPGWDAAIFLPIIDLTPGAGYDPNPAAWNSFTQFSGVQGQNNWHYLETPRDSNAYTPMTTLGNDGYRDYWEWDNGMGTESWCRLFPDAGHPGWNRDCVRGWHAPADGALRIDSIENIRKAYVDGDGVTVTILRNDEELWSRFVAGNDLVGYDLSLRLNVRAGDWIYVRLNSGPVQSSYGDWIMTKLALELFPEGAPCNPVTELFGDQHINTPTVWKDGHYKIHGHVFLEPGGLLKVYHSTVELMCTYSREFNFYWWGGALETTHTTIGGTKTNGLVYHCNFEAASGAWTSTDTTVRHTYGQLYGDSTHFTTMRGLRHNAGPNSDGIIMSGRSDVTLTDSRYPVALNMFLDGSGTTGDFDFPIDRPLDMVLDNTNVPGAPYRLELKNCVVPFWWIFPNNITMTGTPTEVILRNCPSLCANISGADLTGTVNLPCRTSTTENMPANTSVTVGNLTYRTLDLPALIAGWGVYLSGTGTDLTFTGPTSIAEYMVFDGTSALVGQPGTYNAESGATTIEVGRWWGNPPSTANLLLRNATIGQFSQWSNIMGQITAQGAGQVRIEHARMKNVILITEDTATISLCDCETEGEIRLIQNGGAITFADRCADGAPPVADFTASVTTGDWPLTVTFTDTSTNSPTDRHWDFDNDGHADSADSAPTHTYFSPGTYTVTLGVTNPDGSDEEVKPHYITVTGPVFGDVDLSGAVDAVDVQLVINAALDIEVAHDCDLNHDGAVNAIDIQLTINAALGLVS